MYALDVAAIGGESLLASSGKIYNEIAATRPDVIHVLADD
jgi:Taurine catabolism dioxygenase TauD, TfdA family